VVVQNLQSFFMKKSLVSLVIFSIALIETIVSCRKPPNYNKPPIAVAGPDQVITLPTDSASLDGSASSDPDGKISDWHWQKISGPASFNILNATSAKAFVKNLDTGVYRFELTVKDNGGLSANDTIQITVTREDPKNRPPVAHAGKDTVITLPSNSVNLDGSASNDPDNNITAYQWTKMEGPSSFNIVNANSVTTQVTNLSEGVYQFELKVTDADGLFSKDTLQITVNAVTMALACDNTNRPIVNAQLIPVGTLSQARYNMSVASAGNKILFAGGAGPSSRVDIYDLNTGTSSIAELSVGRYGMSVVAAGNKIFLAGGAAWDDEFNDEPLDNVDIYDVSTNTWTTSHLSLPGIDMAGATVGDNVLFAGGWGGGHQNRVDICNLTLDTWSTYQFSETHRVGMSAVASNNKIYFAGGATYGNGGWSPPATIDIYDNASNTWTTSAMQIPRANGQVAVSAGNKIYWAGGDTVVNGMQQARCTVEIRDVTTGNSSIQYLSKPGFPVAVIKDNKIIFCRNFPSINSSAPAEANKFDIYDINTGSWSIGVLNQPIPFLASIISVNNTIYVAGGAFNVADNGDLFNFTNQVWKLEF